VHLHVGAADDAEQVTVHVQCLDAHLVGVRVRFRVRVR
jgi:hypothetical protein